MSKSDILLASIDQFYSHPSHREKLLAILHKKSHISLRNIEWFITNYSRKNHTHYEIDGKPFVVHSAYKSSLDGFSKAFFDPFARSSKISYRVPGTEEDISTTVAQLNFLRWCIRSKLLDYMETNRLALFKK
jgi:hypothetical protein